MCNRRLGALAALFSCLLFGSPLVGSAQAQPLCDTRARVLAKLVERYGEESVALGVTNSGALLELLTAPDGSTWTVLVTTPQGMACLVAAGEGWRRRPRVSPDPDA